MSSNHVLAEAAALYDIAYRRFMERHIADAEVARAQAEVDRSAGWLAGRPTAAYHHVTSNLVYYNI